MRDSAAAPQVILCVDLDGSLSRSDTLVEAVLMLLKQEPLTLFMLPFWLLKGKARFKAEVAKRIDFDASGLAYRDDLLEWLRSEKESGRPIFIASGADERIVSRIAAHHGIFDGFVSSNGQTNLTGPAKAATLKARFDRFIYVGNSKRDEPVWRDAVDAILVTETRREERILTKRRSFARVFGPSSENTSRIKLWVKALRVHQWVKNGLMFVPLILSHQVTDVTKLTLLMMGFLAFNLCASSVYLLNDLLDLGADRRHPRKRLRPFAAVSLPLEHGLAVIPVLLVGAFGMAFLTSLPFAGVLAGYYVLTLAYSLDLKRRALVDVFTLAALYTIRILAGAVLVSVPLSPWLVGFSVFFFLSLGVAKRVAELDSARQRSVLVLHGRGYGTDDLPILEVLGVASGYASVVVMALYLSAPEAQVLYPRHELLWLFVPIILFWISRVWLKTHRGEMHDDPIVFALSDGVSWAIALAAAAVFLLAAV